MYDVYVNDESCYRHGFLCVRRPNIPTRQKRYITHQALNGDGTIYRDTGCVEDIDITISFNFMTRPWKFNTVKREFSRLMHSCKELTFSDDQDFFYKVKKVEVGEVQRKTQEKGDVDVTFTCEGYQYLHAGQRFYSDPDKYQYNPYDKCFPTYEVTGTATGMVEVNGLGFEVDLAEEGTLCIDTVRQICYDPENPSRRLNTLTNAPYGDLYLKHGRNTVRVFGSNYSLRVMPNWRD